MQNETSPRLSQYTASYLRTNSARGEGEGLTIQSYLHGKLRGAAKSYSSKYVASLERAMEYLMRKGDVVKGSSKMGRTAFYPVA